MTRGRTREKDGKAILFFLDKMTINKISILSEQSGMSRSTYIDFVFSKIYDINAEQTGQRHIHDSIIAADEEIERQRAKKAQLEEQLRIRDQIINNERFKNETDKEHIKMKEFFIQNLVRLRLEGSSVVDLQSYATNQSLILGQKYSPQELISEALERIDRK